MENTEIKREYILDVIQLLDEAEPAILRLDEHEEFHENWKTILRVLHSIKGSAGMFGFKELERHIHKVEDLCVQFQYDTQSKFIEEIGNYILNAIDKTRLYLLEGEQSYLHNFQHYENIEDYINQFKHDIVQEKEVINKENIQEEEEEEESKTERDQKIEDSKDAFIDNHKYKILIVDDDKQQLDFYDLYLADLNVSIIKESSPQNALKNIITHNPDILILDYKMPNVSGLELHCKVKNKGIDIPTIFATGADDPILFEEISNQGAFAILSKPINKSMLIYTLNQVFKIIDKQKALKRSLHLVRTYFDCLKDYYQKNGKGHRVEHLKNEIIELYKMI